MVTGRATVLVEPNRIETWDVAIADPEPGGALVRVVIGGVCGSDVHIATGEVGVMPFPIILGHEGVGRVDVICPGFTADCLETLEEIAMEGRETFLEAGGKEFHYIPTTNDLGPWMTALSIIAIENLEGWVGRAPQKEPLPC